MAESIPAFRNSPELLLIKRGPIDGPKFFLESPFRSGYFLAATAVSLVGVFTALFILYAEWQRLSTFQAAVIWTVGYGLSVTWWRAYRYTKRGRGLYLDGSITEVEPGSPLEIALGIAAGAITEILFFGSGATMLLLGYARILLTRLPPK
jgi:hypothetical protein